MKNYKRMAMCLSVMVGFSLTPGLRAGNQPAVNPATSAQTVGLLAQAKPKYQSDYGYEGGKTDRSAKSSPATTAGRPTRFNKASSLIGMEVQNDQNEDLGRIKDIVFDLKKGTVSYLVMSTGGVLGIGEKLLAAPLAAFTRSADQSHLVMNAEKDSIARAEGIGSNWPSVQNPTYGALPFWQKPEAGTEPGSESSTPHPADHPEK